MPLSPHIVRRSITSSHLQLVDCLADVVECGVLTFSAQVTAEDAPMGPQHCSTTDEAKSSGWGFQQVKVLHAFVNGYI